MSKSKVIKKDEKVPAIPPSDYKGTQADWMVCLTERGLTMDSYISQDDWWEILEECEG